MTERVLVTGVDPFGGQRANSSLEILRRLKERGIPSVDLVTKKRAKQIKAKFAVAGEREEP